MEYDLKMLSGNNICEIEQTVDKLIVSEYGTIKYEIEFLGILRDSMRKDRIVTLDVFFSVGKRHDRMVLDIIYEPDYSILYISKVEIFECVASPYNSSFILNNCEIYSIFTYI